MKKEFPQGMEVSSDTTHSRIDRQVRQPLKGRLKIPTSIGESSQTRLTLRGIFKHSLFLLILLALPFFVLDLKTPALNDGEAMYAEIAKEMRTTGDWITPHLNGNRHFDKPPLTYWLIAGAQELMGETETSARICSALAAWGSIGLVGLIGTTLYGQWAGLLSALIYATSLGPYIFGRLVMPDPILIFWIALAILGYSRSYLQDGNGGRGPWFWVMYASLGLAVLTKSILGLGLPAAIIGLHLLLSGRLRGFFSRRLLLGGVVTAAIALPWHIAVARANPDFLGYYVIRENLLRFNGQRYPADEFLPLSLFLLLTLLWTFPWITLVPQALCRSIRRLHFPSLKQLLTSRPLQQTSSLHDNADLLPLLWVIVVLGLFSASHSRLEYYALPCIPAFALLVGKLWSEVIGGYGEAPLHVHVKAQMPSPRANANGMLPGGQQPPSRRSIVLALAVMAVLMSIAAIAALVLLGPARERISHIITNAWPTGGWTGNPEQMATLERIRIPAMASFAGATVFSGGALLAAVRGHFKAACGLLVIMMAPFFVMVHWGFLAVEPFQSIRPVAEIVSANAGPDDIVVFPEPHEYMWVGGITYYTDRPVYILKDPQFDGLTSRRREPPERFLDDKGLLSLWASPRRILMVTEAKGPLYRLLSGMDPVHVLGETGGYEVLSNHE